jgi:hypothetical protein
MLDAGIVETKKTLKIHVLSEIVSIGFFILEVVSYPRKYI